MDPPTLFGDWLRQKRKALGLTRAQLAQRVGCSVSALRKMEVGERRPSLQIAGLLANGLSLPLETHPTFLKVARGELSVDRLPAVAGPEAVRAPAAPRLAPRASLPVHSTPLLGRQRELADLDQLLGDPGCRLLTLVGPGGIGKTRLAIEVARRRSEAFADGACFVSLAPLKSSDFIVPAIADAVGFAFSGPADAQTQLLNYLQGRQALLVMDNAEHLLDGIELLTEVLQRAQSVRLLVTSREILGLHDEWVFEVQGLPIPVPATLAVAGEDGSEEIGLEANSAVELFLQRARRAHVGFAPAASDYPPIVRICQLVEGMPLGIELAAAWTRTLTCSEIVQEMERGLGFLTASTRDMPARHRSMRAVFDHSWRLLNEDEQRALCQLTVFQGGFRREAAERVAGASLSLLSALLAKSLLRRAGAGRYDLHEVIRQYASAHLDEDPRNSETYERHCEYYLGFARDREAALRGRDQQEAIRAIRVEMDNVRAAWTQALEHRNFALVGQAVRSLGGFFEITGLLREGIEQLALLVQALKASAGDDRWQGVLGPTLAYQGLLYFRKGQYDKARQCYEDSIAILRKVGDPRPLAEALVFLAIISYLTGEYVEAKSLLEEGLVCAQAGDDRWIATYATFNLGYVASLMGDYALGYEQMLAGLTAWRTLEDPHSISLGLNFLVPTLIKLGRYEEANAFLQESIALCEESNDRWGMGTAYRFFGIASLSQGSYSEAQAYLRKSLEVFDEFVVGWDIARTRSYLGDALQLAGNLSEARQTYMSALQQSMAAQAIPIALDVMAGLAQLHARAGNSESALELSYVVLNHPASTQDAKDRILPFFKNLEAQPTLEQVETVEGRTRSDSFELIVEELLEAQS